MDVRPLGGVIQPGTAAPASTDVGTSTVAASAVENSSVAQATAPAPSPAVAPQPEPSAEQVNQAVQKINATLSAQSQGIEFAIDPSSHRIVVKVVDQQTNQVIRQIPSKEALAIADSIDQGSFDQTQGLLIKQQA